MSLSSYLHLHLRYKPGSELKLKTIFEHYKVSVMGYPAPTYRAFREEFTRILISFEGPSRIIRKQNTYFVTNIALIPPGGEGEDLRALTEAFYSLETKDSTRR